MKLLILSLLLIAAYLYIISYTTYFMHYEIAIGIFATVNLKTVINIFKN